MYCPSVMQINKGTAALETLVLVCFKFTKGRQRATTNGVTLKFLLNQEILLIQPMFYGAEDEQKVLDRFLLS